LFCAIALGALLGCGVETSSAGDEDGISGLDSETADPEDEDGDDDDDDDDDDDTKWDVSSGLDVGVGCGEPDEEDALLSYIWIANSSQGTMSKIDTETMVEEGRYMVRPDGAGSPSRTTVALSGNVAIAARHGGVTKVWANHADCVESNGQPGLQTSEGGLDVLAWDVEECRAWHTPLGYESNRPMAWAPGVFNDNTCKWQDEKLWTSGWNHGGPEILLLNGDSGAVEEWIEVPDEPKHLYGGAVDGNGNFWGLVRNDNLIRVDREDFTLQSWEYPGGPGYGISVDSKGRPWLCGGGHASRFDPEAETWQTTPGGLEVYGIGGCMTDGNGTLYTGLYGWGKLIAIDTETVTHAGQYVIPSYVHGVSVDFAGKVWGVSFSGSDAYRVDPETGHYDVFSGLTGAYTYSDMTGFALSHAGTPAG
jgi:hypothetical protein